MAGFRRFFVIALRSKTFTTLLENGLILGVMPFASYQSKALTPGSGDEIPLYTDCVIEADQRVKEFGEERIKRTLSRPLSAQDLCRSLGADVSPWSQGTAHDDVTMVAVDIA